jgi:hypothetical protein
MKKIKIGAISFFQTEISLDETGKKYLQSAILEFMEAGGILTLTDWHSLSRVEKDIYLETARDLRRISKEVQE